MTRRVLAITDHSEQRLFLAVERFGRTKPDRLEFVRREFERGARQLRHSSAGGTLAGLRVILPKNTARTVAHRFGALDPRLPVDLYQHEPTLNVLEKIDHCHGA